MDTLVKQRPQRHAHNRPRKIHKQIAPRQLQESRYPQRNHSLERVQHNSNLQLHSTKILIKKRKNIAVIALTANADNLLMVILLSNLTLNIINMAIR